MKIHFSADLYQASCKEINVCCLALIRLGEVKKKPLGGMEEGEAGKEDFSEEKEETGAESEERQEFETNRLRVEESQGNYLSQKTLPDLLSPSWIA